MQNRNPKKRKQYKLPLIQKAVHAKNSIEGIVPEKMKAPLTYENWLIKMKRGQWRRLKNRKTMLSKLLAA